WKSVPLPAAPEQQITDHCSLSRYQLHWQAGKLSEAVAELALRFADDGDPLNPRGERRHEHLGLEARQHLADAQMNAGAEGNVTGGPAVDVEALRFVPAARIAVSGGQEQQYLRVLRDFDPADVDRAGGGAEERLDR